MSKQIRAADLGGAAQGLYIPEYASDIVISELHNCSALMHVVNKSYDIANLGLDCAAVAHYTILSGIEVGDFTGNNWNGESWEPDDPFRSGEITLCHQIPIKKKFARNEAIALCSRWATVQDGYETSIGLALRDLTERYGFRMLVSMAHKQLQGNQAGAISQNIRLGDTANPVAIGKGNVGAMELLQRMEQALQESGVTCGGNALKVVASPAFFGKIRAEQSALGAGCCLKDNPAVTGMIHPVLGMEVFSSLHMPRFKRANDGKVVEYVLMVDPQHIAAPTRLDYLEWQTVLNDIYLVGNYRFDVAALSNKSIAVAAITMEG